jgi:hypothetical protein
MNDSSRIYETREYDIDYLHDARLIFFFFFVVVVVVVIFTCEES